MKSLRLLPIVIYASVALLLFKGIGLITDGAYVLVGAPPVAAATEAPAETGDPLGGASEMTLEDTSPTLNDTSPTISTKPDAPPEDPHGAPAGGAHGAPAETEAAASGASPDGGSGHTSMEAGGSSEAVAVMGDVACAGMDAVLPSSEPLPPGAGPTEITEPEAMTDCVSSAPPTTAEGDAVATTMTADGKLVPLSELSDDNSEAALLARLGERRAALDKFASDLDVRAALVEAAERRLNERTAALKDLEAQIAAMVDQKEAEKEAQFKAVISMYETMKPRDAAKIFDALDTRVLLRVARAMNPRKMAPILAAMAATRAQELTAAMATDTPPPLVAAAGEDLANLPQIVGK